MLSLRKTVLVFHVATSVGLIGAVSSFLLLAVVGLFDSPTVYGAADVIARLAIVPLAIASLAIGLVQALVSPWGIFRHYWVIVKLVTTAIVLGVLLLQLPGISTLAEIPSTDMNLAAKVALRQSLVLHSVGGLAFLVLCLVLSVFKPKGLTPYGWRKGKRAP
jgi:hypothetical protein